jgi:lipopolysaccharide export system protein LptA
MARWQRHARFGFGLFAVAFAGVVWFMLNERQAPSPVQAIERLDPAAATEIRGGDVVQVKGAAQDIRVEFDSQILYPDGRTRFTTFSAYIDDRGGRSFAVTGNEAFVAAERAAYDVRGDVTLKTSDGLTATTPEVTFTDADGIVRGGGPVRFQRGRVSGSGVGFTYDRALDRLWLMDQAVIHVAPTGASGAMQVTSGAAGHSRTERYMRFERGMRMERDGQLIEADHASLFMLADRDEPETIELRGGSRITGAAGTGSLQAMHARDINLRYAADGRTLEQALLMGRSTLQLAGVGAAPGQQLTAEYMDVSLTADGSVRSLGAREQVRVTLPASGEAGARIVQAPLLNAQGEAGRGLTQMKFANGVEYREEGRAGTNSRLARAQTLDAALTPTGAMDEAAFGGGFRFQDGRLTATSTDARYHVTHGTLQLESAPGAARPHVADDRVAIDATDIAVTLSPRQMTASGKVRTELSPDRRRDGERGNSLLADSEAVVVTADALRYDETAAQATYTGQAHLFQASGTSIRAESISTDEREGRLTAAGNVVSMLPIAGHDAAAPRGGTSLARAGSFEFDEAKRHAVFSTQAQLDGAHGNLHANTIELRLAAGDNTLERLEARESVKVILDTREATGQHLLYHPADERYVLTGSPVRLVQDCQESTGRTLTFYRNSDRISVDGNQEMRVQTKGSKCPD